MRVIEETPAYWRVVFDYPPFNIVDASIFEALQDLLARMDASPSLRVVVFGSANPEFYLAHFDLTGKIGNIMTAVGSSGLPILMDTFLRLTKSPVVSIAKIRGCVRGVSSEFVLACDMRFASRENTRLGQPEVGVGLYPGGGGAERLPHLVGRGRALEIVLGANDFDGDTAERYGYVNRALADAELDGVVDTLARRIASFDRGAIAAAKGLVNQVSLPSADRLLDALNSFQTALTWPETQHRIQSLLQRGLQQRQRLRESLARGARLDPGGIVNEWRYVAPRRWQNYFADRHRYFSAQPQSHGKLGAEPVLTQRNAIVCFRFLCQRVRLHNRFHFSQRYEIERLCPTA